MSISKKTRKFSKVKRLLNPKDERITLNAHSSATKKSKSNEMIKQVNPVSSYMFFSYNENLVPPYQVIVDTNFINSSIQNKLDLFRASSDCLLAKCNMCVTDCIIGELEKLGHRYRLALSLAKDPRVTRLTCCHKGTYADDCIVQRVTQHRCYIIGTNDKDLKCRIRKVPGVPIMYVSKHKYQIERLPNTIT
ncbi:UTP24, FCF1, U3 small nucleolar RNA-associated protein 24 [Babesia microti strain RI]|uniref:UTP24, FCF1, U3 small nucleolar RNA-associated protein 24 n=1 Tax=Babesia microti (strain RI) TaxID=1133968 RepID=A0A0K3AQG1_BABMR|nr:UTP24, FCF1, U3 small nucleolar RNA-associated protein 24 [Babesia microti strain RI]CTQ40685.1 UTP24, FCF1, U3 small nucleolar RNA-associated protein 24 [Babesia microti strain RI]|eukprot:XP_012648696.1 UTP24, FCF1, U3 small nucleolar RNA-associated protein 24 [Babesia microti strain RI]